MAFQLSDVGRWIAHLDSRPAFQVATGAKPVRSHQQPDRPELPIRSEDAGAMSLRPMRKLPDLTVAAAALPLVHAENLSVALGQGSKRQLVLQNVDLAVRKGHSSR